MSLALAASNSSSLSTPWALRSARRAIWLARSSPLPAGAGAGRGLGVDDLRLLLGHLGLVGRLVLRGVLLLLVVRDRTGRTGDHRGGRSGPDESTSTSNHGVPFGCSEGAEGSGLRQ